MRYSTLVRVLVAGLVGLSFWTVALLAIVQQLRTIELTGLKEEFASRHEKMLADVGTVQAEQNMRLKRLQESHDELKSTQELQSARSDAHEPFGEGVMPLLPTSAPARRAVGNYILGTSSASGCFEISGSSAVTKDLSDNSACTNRCPACFFASSLGADVTLTLSACSTALVTQSASYVGMREFMVINGDDTDTLTVTDGTNSFLLGPMNMVYATCYSSGSNKLYFQSNYGVAGANVATCPDGCDVLSPFKSSDKTAFSTTTNIAAASVTELNYVVDAGTWTAAIANQAFFVANGGTWTQTIANQAFFVANGGVWDAAIGNRAFYLANGGTYTQAIANQAFYLADAGVWTAAKATRVFDFVSANAWTATKADYIFLLAGQTWTANLVQYLLYLATAGTWTQAIANQAFFVANGGVWTAAIGNRAFYLANGGAYTQAIANQAFFVANGGVWDAAIGNQAFYLANGGTYTQAIANQAFFVANGGAWDAALGNQAFYLADAGTWTTAKAARVWDFVRNKAWTTTEASNLFELAAADPAAGAITYETAASCSGTSNVICDAR